MPFRRPSLHATLALLALCQVLMKTVESCKVLCKRDYTEKEMAAFADKIEVNAHSTLTKKSGHKNLAKQAFVFIATIFATFSL
jgi:hypothetical protein